MSLKIEFTKNGKPKILFNNNKYRESYSLKSGEIIWRCLGRNCGATIKSNSERTTVTTVNFKHSGPHPVTMRALTSPRISSSLPATPPAAETTTPRSSTTPSPTHAGSPIEALTQTATSGSRHTISGAVSDSALPRSSSGLEAENFELRRRIDQPTAEREQILDHSIHSDARLLQFTDQLFVANLSTIKTPGGRTADCAVQCDLSSSTACQDPRCIEIRNLVASLKTTVEVLEAELECFKAETVKKSKTRSDSENEGWVVVQNKSKRNSKSNPKSENILSEHKRHKKSVQKNQNAKFKLTKNAHRNNISNISHIHHPGNNHPQNVKGSEKKKLPFPAVFIEGDSHVRHLIGLVRQRASPSTRVGGTCRPGAKLLTVTDNGLPPPGSCYVLFAGTNDVAADESYTIFEHLERQLTARLSSSAVIVSTVPHRHDLSMNYAVNQHVSLVNFYIEEVSVRYKGIEVLNFNEIGRRWFTQHGMHLRLPGKRLLAELLLGCLDRFGQSPTIRPPTSPAHAASSCAASSTPLSSLPALSPTAVQPVEPVIVGSTTSRPVRLLKTPGPASSRFALVPSPEGAMTRPGNKTFAEAINSCPPATSSPVPSVKVDSGFLGAPRLADERN
ncbi:hypothetical protein J6590_010347 [Homalodisca vitripennis]|nr:hypothetical protein J6590_010347 [Homalodisca vitripennis]